VAHLGVTNLLVGVALYPVFGARQQMEIVENIIAPVAMGNG